MDVLHAPSNLKARKGVYDIYFKGHLHVVDFSLNIVH